MQSQQPTSNPYDFLTNTPAKPKRSFSSGGSSTKMRVLVVVGGVIFLIIIAVVFMSILSSAGKAGTQALISLTQEQTEISRVSTIGINKARDSIARNLAINTQLSIETSKKQTVDLLKKRGHKLNAKTLALKKNAQTDTELNAAALNNTFDETFTQFMQSALTTYRANLKKAYDASTSDTEKQILSDSYNGVNILLGEQATQ